MFYKFFMLNLMILLSQCAQPTHYNFSSMAHSIPDSLWKQQAHVALKQYQNLIPPDEAHLFGFDSIEEIKNAEIDQAIPLFYLNSNGEINSIINTVYVPIKTNEKYKAFIRLDRQDNQWVNAGFGSADLAKNIQDLFSIDPKTKQSPILRITWLGSDYMPITLESGYEAYQIHSKKSFLWPQLPKNPQVGVLNQ